MLDRPAADLENVAISVTRCWNFKSDPIVSKVAQKVVDAVVFSIETDVFKRPQKS